MKISEYLLNKDKYKVDETYQRPANVWSRKDKQCLIDTIIRGEPVPIFFLNYKSDEDAYYIVDGQQRLCCIADFHNNKFPLSKEFSEESLDGKKFNNLKKDEREAFLNFDLTPHILEDYDDERVRMIFSRLQRGKPLCMGERLNAKPGKIVYAMRELAKHDFIAKSIGVNKERFHTYEDVARIIFYEKFGTKECSTNPINEMFEKYKDEIIIDSKIYKKIQNILNYLLKCFPADPGNYKYLEKHAWVYTVYTVISDLKDTYVLNGREAEIKKFIEKFHSKVYNPDFRKSNTKYMIFYDCSRGGWSEKLNKTRKDIMKEFMIKELDLKVLDINRQITNEEKIAAYDKANSRCERCGFEFKDYKEPEYHHIEMYSHGGASKVDNIMVLCKNCHDEIHRKEASDQALTEEDMIDGDSE